MMVEVKMNNCQDNVLHTILSDTFDDFKFYLNQYFKYNFLPMAIDGTNH